MTLGICVALAVFVARTILPKAAAMAAKGSAELYQLSVVSWCLLVGWIFGHLVRLPAHPRLLLPCVPVWETARVAPAGHSSCLSSICCCYCSTCRTFIACGCLQPVNTLHCRTGSKPQP